MICKDLLGLKGLKNEIHLIAGEEGLDRNLRWIYFADCTECLKLEEKNELSEWIHGGELVVVTNQSFFNDNKKLLDIMRLFNEKLVAGFVVNEGAASDEAKKLADEMKLPLFEMSWNIKLVDLSWILCHALSEEVKEDTSLSQFLSNILYNNGISHEDIMIRAEHWGYNLKKPHFITIFDVDHLTAKVRKQEISLERKKDICEFLNSVIKSELKKFFVSRPLTRMQGDIVMVFLAEDTLSHEQYQQFLKNVQNEFKHKFKMTVSVGIGELKNDLSEFHISVIEAEKAIECLHCTNRTNAIMDYRNMGVFYLIANIGDKNILSYYYKQQLGELEAADQFSDGVLMETLGVYLENNCNANEAAKQLFIHRNTMHYRLEKIIDILGCDFNDMDDCTRLNMAFHIKKYLK